MWTKQVHPGPTGTETILVFLMNTSRENLSARVDIKGVGGTFKTHTILKEFGEFHQWGLYNSHYQVTSTSDEVRMTITYSTE